MPTNQKISALAKILLALSLLASLAMGYDYHKKKKKEEIVISQLSTQELRDLALKQTLSYGVEGLYISNKDANLDKQIVYVYKSYNAYYALNLASIYGLPAYYDRANRITRLHKRLDLGTVFLYNLRTNNNINSDDNLSGGKIYSFDNGKIRYLKGHITRNTLNIQISVDRLGLLGERVIWYKLGEDEAKEYANLLVSSPILTSSASSVGEGMSIELAPTHNAIPSLSMEKLDELLASSPSELAGLYKMRDKYGNKRVFIIGTLSGKGYSTKGHSRQKLAASNIYGYEIIHTKLQDIKNDNKALRQRSNIGVPVFYNLLSSKKSGRYKHGFYYDFSSGNTLYAKARVKNGVINIKASKSYMVVTGLKMQLVKIKDLDKYKKRLARFKELLSKHIAGAKARKTRFIKELESEKKDKEAIEEEDDF